MKSADEISYILEDAETWASSLLTTHGPPSFLCTYGKLVCGYGEPRVCTFLRSKVTRPDRLKPVTMHVSSAILLCISMKFELMEGGRVISILLFS